jgi:predicted nucleotidyltransferase
MSAAPSIREHRDEILRLATRHGAGNVLLFGSVAAGKTRRKAMSTCLSM